MGAAPHAKTPGRTSRDETGLASRVRADCGEAAAPGWHHRVGDHPGPRTLGRGRTRTGGEARPSSRVGRQQTIAGGLSGEAVCGLDGPTVSEPPALLLKEATNT